MAAALAKRAKPIRIITAFARNRVIGRDGKIPWSIPEDWQYLVDSVRGGVGVIGRKSFEADGIPGVASTIVLSSKRDLQCAGAHVCASLEEALELGQKVDGDCIWICGGELLYREAFAVADQLWATRIHADVDGDTYFPDGWQQVFTQELSMRKSRDANFEYEFMILARAGVPSPTKGA